MNRIRGRAFRRVRVPRPVRLEMLEQRILLSTAPTPLAVDTSADGKVTVSIYDPTNPGAVTPSNIKVVFGKKDAITSITLTGTGMDGLGLVISGGYLHRFDH